MLVEPGIVDANVLAYGINVDAPQYTASRALLDAARDPSTTLYVTSKILCEFYSVITNPRRVAEVSSASKAFQIVSDVRALPGLHVLPIPGRAVWAWMELLQRHPVTGADIFDLQIVAAMKANDVGRIYTYNIIDFAVFPELAVVMP
jgi:predicted nucleic acid-binding protein